MKKDHFRENTALDKGRKKIYHLKEGNIELLNPSNGSLVGYLEKGDLAYQTGQAKDESGNKLLVFRAMKYVGKKNQNTLFKAKMDLFDKHYTEDKDGKLNSDGDKKDPKVEAPSVASLQGKKDKKNNLIIPAITGVGIGAVCFALAKKYNKNIWIYSLVGLGIGATLGHLIINKGLIKKFKK